MNTRRASLVTIIFIFHIFLISNIYAEDKSKLIIDNFEYGSWKKFTKTWRMRSESRSKRIARAKVYQIKSMGSNKYLSASTSKYNRRTVQIGRLVNNINFNKSKIHWKLKKYPNLQWKWRAVKLPKNGNEKLSYRNDSVAAIYVVFQRVSIPFLSWRWQPVNVIKYVWSSTLPKGTVIKKRSKKFGITYYKGRYVVVETGNARRGRWITIRRNILKDYKRLFGKNPKYNPILIGILTDGNSTKTHVIGEYDSIIAIK